MAKLRARQDGVGAPAGLLEVRRGVVRRALAGIYTGLAKLIAQPGLCLLQQCRTVRELCILGLEDQVPQPAPSNVEAGRAFAGWQAVVASHLCRVTSRRSAFAGTHQLAQRDEVRSIAVERSSHGLLRWRPNGDKRRSLRDRGCSTQAKRKQETKKRRWNADTQTDGPCDQGCSAASVAGTTGSSKDSGAGSTAALGAGPERSMRNSISKPSLRILWSM